MTDGECWGQRQAMVSGRRARDGGEVNSSCGHTALESPVAGKGRGFVDYMPKYSNRRGCLVFLALWGKACSSSYLLSNRPVHQVSVQNKVVKTWLSAWKESRIGLEDRGPVVLEN